MRLNFKNVLKNASILTVLSILTGLYVISAYFIIHTAWLYNSPDSSFRSHHGYFALVNSVAYFLLFLPFGITAYYHEYSKNKDLLFASKFPPEFAGRIDKVIPFMSLSIEDYKVIVRRLAKKYNKNVDVDAIVKKPTNFREIWGKTVYKEGGRGYIGFI